MKVVINACFGGFSLSKEAVERYAQIKGITLYPQKDRFNLWTYWTVPEDQRPRELAPGEWQRMPLEDRKAHNQAYSKSHIYNRDIPRDDAALVRVVEELGDAANGACAKLRVVEIPDGVQYEIQEYDGNEHVAETHRTWS